MTPRPFNPENAVIYKICCKDENVKEIYVGSSENFKDRRRSHKKNCKNEIYKDHNMFVYKFIRENGGWDNWEMIEICKANECIDKQDLHKKEREYIELLKSTLNNNVPTRTDKEWREENKEILKEKKRKYFKSYLEKNRDEINRKHREQYALKKSQSIQV